MIRMILRKLLIGGSLLATAAILFTANLSGSSHTFFNEANACGQAEFQQCFNACVTAYCPTWDPSCTIWAFGECANYCLPLLC